jgi:LEA14-like dessication related protein
MVRLASITLAVAFIVGCGGPQNPELHVLKVRNVQHQEVVFVQVSNPAKKAMRLTKLEYTFAAGSSTVSEGEVELSRDVPAGAAVIVEVPLDIADDGTPTQPMTLRGRLTAELDEIVRTFKVSAQIEPDQVVSK